MTPSTTRCSCVNRIRAGPASRVRSLAAVTTPSALGSPPQARTTAALPSNSARRTPLPPSTTPAQAAGQLRQPVGHIGDLVGGWQLDRLVGAEVVELHRHRRLPARHRLLVRL